MSILCLASPSALHADAPNTPGPFAAASQESSPATIESHPVPSQAVRLAQRVGGIVGLLLVLLIFGGGLVTFARPNLEIIADTASHSLGRSLVAGLLGQLLVVPTLALLLVGLAATVVGIFLIPFTLVVVATLTLVTLLCGLLALAYTMGETITRRQLAMGLRASPNGYRFVITGLLTWAALWSIWGVFGGIPVAGALLLGLAGLATWLGATAGFGALLLSRGGAHEHFAGPIIPATLLTDEHLWATPRMGVPAVKRPPPTKP